MYKYIIYIIVVFVTTFACTGLNINSLFKQGKVVEARIFIIFFILALSELVCEFIFNFLEASNVM